MKPETFKQNIEAPTEIKSSTFEATFAMRRDELKPEVRKYADNLHAQIIAIYREFGVNNGDELEAAAHAGRIPKETLHHLLDITNQLLAVLEKGERLPVWQSQWLVVVPNTINPYREALLECGLADDSPEVAERKDITIDIAEEIQRQAAVYLEKDETGQPVLPEWADDITSHQDFLLAEISKREEREKIIKRIEHGMIPIVMPSRSVQETTWRRSITKLKPSWRKDGVVQTVYASHMIDNDDPDPSKNPSKQGFSQNIPNRPYLLWTKPTPKGTLEAFINDIYYTELIKQNPDLYDPIDIIPTEYVALQANFTRSVQEQFKKIERNDVKLTEIKLLDSHGYTMFLSTRYFCGSLLSPNDHFDPYSGLPRVSLGRLGSRASDVCSIRPAARS